MASQQPAFDEASQVNIPSFTDFQNPHQQQVLTAPRRRLFFLFLFPNRSVEGTFSVLGTRTGSCKNASFDT
jgi:hypothetical protein